MVESAISIKDLSKDFQNKRAVDRLTTDIGAGEIFGFLGHNGAGKTTTISMLITLVEPTSGDATIMGRSIRRESLEVRRYIGYLPEQVEMYSELTVRETLVFLGRLSGVRSVKTRVEEVLNDLSMTAWADMRLGLLSKGMRQRAGIAQAILHRPAILFLDEPMSGLDPQAAQEMRTLLVALNRDFGTTICMNTHQLTDAQKLCTSIGILKEGRLITSGRLDDVLSRFPAGSTLEDIYMDAMELAV
jgi:ABC-2 type transport system ATP-binding protein